MHGRVIFRFVHFYKEIYKKQYSFPWLYWPELDRISFGSQPLTPHAQSNHNPNTCCLLDIYNVTQSTSNYLGQC